jgi:hypothetical protein
MLDRMPRTFVLSGARRPPSMCWKEGPLIVAPSGGSRDRILNVSKRLTGRRVFRHLVLDDAMPAPVHLDVTVLALFHADLLGQPNWIPGKPTDFRDNTRTPVVQWIEKEVRHHGSKIR